VKKYRCVFNFSNGRTTIDVLAEDASRALTEATLTVKEDAVNVEIWDETGMVLQKNKEELRPSPLV
jgi:hypothetical protein